MGSVSPERKRRRLTFWQWALIACVVLVVLIELATQTLVPRS